MLILYVYKQKFKCEDLKVALSIISRGYSLFKFDLKSGYHHVEIFPEPIGYSTFRDHLRKTLRGFVPDPQIYGTHSFRSWGASAAANSGVPDRVFQRHGRWKSASAKDGYVEDSTDVKLSVSKSLGL